VGKLATGEAVLEVGQGRILIKQKRGGEWREGRTNVVSVLGDTRCPLKKANMVFALEDARRGKTIKKKANVVSAFYSSCCGGGLVHLHLAGGIFGCRCVVDDKRVRSSWAMNK
jgi:hypothetical protein